MRDIDFGGVYAPPLLVIFILSLAAVWIVDRAIATTGFYDRVWHPALFRTSLFAVIFAAAALRFY